jgi:type III pantothenate kinase
LISRWILSEMTASPAMLAVDIGNTSTSLGVYQNERVTRVQRAASIEPALDLLRVPECAVIASVKPQATEKWKVYLREQGVRRVLEVSHRLDLGIPITYPKPSKIGADRLANACEAAASGTMPVVVCDFGTALTFDVIKPEEGYVGGIICPGLPLMFDYLAEKTALLPHIKPIKTSRKIGKSTEEAMRIGAQVGYRGMVREILNDLQKELGEEMRVYATGGFAKWVLNEFDLPVAMDSNLTLRGLGRIGRLNSSRFRSL